MAKHPTQIYEALAYLIIFVVLLIIYYKKTKDSPAGLLTGWFLILLFSARFMIEFVKQSQVTFENNMILNMGQLLSIPFILGGIALIFYISAEKKKNQ